jgi:hypothetical protein
MTIPILVFSVLECFIRAFHHTDRFFSSCTEVTFGSDLLSVQISLNGTIRTDHDTHPAPHALFLVMENGASLLIPVEGSAHTCLQTIGIFTMATLETERERSLLFNKDTGKAARIFLLKGSKNIF